MFPLKPLSPLLKTELPFSFICFARIRKLQYSEFQILVGFITVSRTYIPFIRTKILTLPLENHYINTRSTVKNDPRGTSRITGKLILLGGPEGWNFSELYNFIND